MKIFFSSRIGSYELGKYSIFFSVPWTITVIKLSPTVIQTQIVWDKFVLMRKYISNLQTISIIEIIITKICCHISWWLSWSTSSYHTCCWWLITWLITWVILWCITNRGKCWNWKNWKNIIYILKLRFFSWITWIDHSKIVCQYISGILWISYNKEVIHKTSCSNCLLASQCHLNVLKKWLI